MAPVSTPHPYVAYASDSEMRTAADRVRSEGLASGQQVGYFGWGRRDALRDRLGGPAASDELLRRGAVRVTSLDEHFGTEEPPDPTSLVAFWSEATESALTAGFA